MLNQLQGPWDKVQSRKAKSGRPWDVGSLDERLLVLMLYYRCYVTQEFLGFFYGVDKSIICRVIQRVEVLAKPLFGLKREPVISKDEAGTLIVDCTEQPIYRPGAEATQKAHYSGKKKRHTLKTEYIITEKGRIVSGSLSYPGSHNDLAVRRGGPKVPDDTRAHGDSAYQGYDKEHPNIDYPYKGLSYAKVSKMTWALLAA